jgi:hypothetical protein
MDKIFGSLNLSKIEMVPIGYNITKIINEVSFGHNSFNFVIKRKKILHKILKMQLFDHFLKFMQSKHQF